MHTDFKGYGVDVTEDGMVRLHLVLDGEPTPQWVNLFKSTTQPVGELLDVYMAHGVEQADGGAYIFIDLKRELPQGAVYQALDWLQETAADVDRQATALDDEVRRLTQMAGQWYRTNVDASG